MPTLLSTPQEEIIQSYESAIWRDNAALINCRVEQREIERCLLFVLDKLKLWQRYTLLLSVSTSVQVGGVVVASILLEIRDKYIYIHNKHTTKLCIAG